MHDWSTHQLTEFFSAITRSGDETGAAELAVERALEATEAEVGAVVAGDRVLVSLGLGVNHRPDAFTRVTPADTTMTIAGLGDFHISATALGGDGELLVAGRLDEPFQPEERQMLKGMSQVLGLALRALRTLAAERDLRREREREAEQRLTLVRALEKREELLETLLQIQRAVCQRAPLQVVLDAVTRGASVVLDGAMVSLVLLDEDGSGRPMVPSITPGHEADRNAPDVVALAAEAMAADHLVVGGPGRILAAPVYVGGDVAGGLVIRLPTAAGSAGDGRDFLAAFAEQASLALTGAHTANEVREAYHDGLTGLPNRVLFLERLERALEHTGRERAGTAVLFIDLDLFKQVNDTLGHAAGDQLLIAVGNRLRGVVRDSDMAARLGGDEFAVMLSPAEPGRPLAVARRITEAIARPFLLGDRETFVRASIGIAVSDAAYDSADDLIQNADVAMYRAKKGVPNHPVVFRPAMRAELLHHVELVADAKQAHAKGQFSLVYQPILRLSDLALVGVEALMRWAHPRFGEIAPATFIPLAEQNGQIAAIGRWALRESCRQLAGWRATGLPDLTLSVNISVRQLSDESLARFTADTLAEYGLPAGALTLEITESALPHDDQQLVRRLTALKTAGVRLAIDDFGTGYSSMSHLSRLPVDQLKIDKSLIDDIGADPRSLAVARSLVELARVLDLETVAEGIERPDQLAALNSLECALGQGFVFARPLGPGDVPAYAAGRLTFTAA